MIKEKTVFIFGAGLSSDYGFPTDYELRGEIIHLLKRDMSIPSIPEQIKRLHELGFIDQELNSFREQFIGGKFRTIDEFLESRKNKRYRELGKIMIAMALILHENPIAVKDKSIDNCFYTFLFRKMASESDKENFTNNNVSFITFNYDRSFEYFLRDTIRHRFEDIQDEQVNNIMNKIKIIHIHGKLGDMHWQSQNSREFNTELSHLNLILASRGILIFDEIDGNHNGYVEARKEINEAKNVVFLGFGFHPLNLSRLKEETTFQGKKRILATSYGLEGHEIDEIHRLTGFGIGLYPEKAVQFQRYLNWL